MKAIIRTKAGKALSTMQVQEQSVSNLKSGEIRVQMSASRINPVDVDLMKGMPFLKYKKPQIGGIDGSGKVLEIASDVQNLQVGDEVFFYRQFTDIGTWAEEITIPAAWAAKIPASISLREAGGVALPFITAYDALQQLGAEAGEKILIHGAGGGVGFPAAQFAKNMGLEVIVTAGERDMEDLKAVGITNILNYKTQDFAEELATGEVDYIFDLIGGEVLLKSIALKPKKVISVHVPDTSKMHHTGIKLPTLLKPLINITTAKFRKAAKKHGVQLIGQVTGPNGTLMQEAAEKATAFGFRTRTAREISLEEIAANGLSEKDFGKVIVF